MPTGAASGADSPMQGAASRRQSAGPAAPATDGPAPAFPRRPIPAGNPFWNAVYQIARKEVLQHLRTKRLLIIGTVLVGLLVLITMVFGPRIANDLPAGFLGSRENLVLAIYFAVGIVGGLQFTQLLSIVLTSDAVCSEWADRTIFLLLSKPVTRAAFVTGKFLGNLVTVAGTLGVLFSLTYLVMQPLYEGSPSGEEVAGFFGMLGVVVLGSAAFASISLFLSTLSRSTVRSLLLMLALWLVVFPLVGAIGVFSHLGEGNFDFDDPEVQGWLYFNPAADMAAGAQLLLPGSGEEFLVGTLNPFAITPNDLGLAILALAAYTVVFFAASILVVRRRNFE